MSPEEDEWPEEANSGLEGPVGSNGSKNQLFGNSGLFSFEGGDEGVGGMSDGMMQWSSGACEVPNSFKELWQDPDLV